MLHGLSRGFLADMVGLLVDSFYIAENRTTTITSIDTLTYQDGRQRRSQGRKGMASHAEFTSHARVDFPEVSWWKHPGLRKLYIVMPILFLGM